MVDALGEIGGLNVELAIEESITAYGRSQQTIDMRFWRTAIAALTKKYGIEEKYKSELEKQQTARGF